MSRLAWAKANAIGIDLFVIIMYIIFCMGASYNGSTGVSKTSCVGSIPAAPALENVALVGYIFIYMKEKHFNWQKVVTREFSFLWASYTKEIYKKMMKITGTCLKDNLFYTENRILTIYRNPYDVKNSYNLIEKLI